MERLDERPPRGRTELERARTLDASTSRGARGADARELVLPHPGALSGRGGFFLLVFALLLGLPGFFLGEPALLVAALFSLVFGVGLVWNASRTVRLERERGLVRLPKEQGLLPEGEGHVEVLTERIENRNGYHLRYRVRHVVHGRGETKLTETASFLAARAFAERVARFGGWDLVWHMGDGPPEVRRAAELDLPFAQRLSGRTEALAPRPPEGQPGLAKMTELGEGRFLVRWPYSIWQRLGGAAVFALGAGFSYFVKDHGLLSLVPASFGGLLALSAGIRNELHVSPTEIELRYRLFGRLHLFSQRIAARQIESVLVEDGADALQLHLAGDDESLQIPCPGGLLEVALTRYAVERALMTGALPAAQAIPEARGGCPRCFIALKPQGGPLDESQCSSCHGRFLPAHGAERLVVEELGFSRTLLRQIAEVFGGARLYCAGCGSRMRPVRLKGVDADLCFGCGALWLDAGELEALSQGRYSG